MKSIKILTVIFILFVYLQVCFGQENEKAVLVVKLNQTGCENYAQLLDRWFVEVNKTPAAKGYAVIRGNKNNFLQRLYYREWIYGQLLLRFGKKAENGRFIAIDGDESEDLEIQLWNVPAGAETPFQTNRSWNFELKLNKPLILFRSEDDGGICPYFDDAKVFGELLRSNLNLRGNIVFYESKASEFRKRKAALLKRIEGVSLKRLRFFQSKLNFDGHYELWLIP